MLELERSMSKIVMVWLLDSLSRDFLLCFIFEMAMFDMLTVVLQLL
jgi:hypothetical protein